MEQKTRVPLSSLYLGDTDGCVPPNSQTQDPKTYFLANISYEIVLFWLKLSKFSRKGAICSVSSIFVITLMEKD